MIEQIINGFFCWLNTNDGFLSLLTVVISLAACILSLLSARAAWAQVREMRRQYEEENRNRQPSKYWRAIPAIGRSIRKNPCPRANCRAARSGWKMTPRKNGSGSEKSSPRWGC